MKKTLLMLLLLIASSAYAQSLKKVQDGVNSSVRALSVVDKSTIWLGGSNGWFAKSNDGGKKWEWNQLKDYATFDFRGIYAFSSKKAILMSSGSPAVILYTDDGGQSWMETYRNNSKEIFLDGISFWNANEGLVYGDPINNKMQLLKSDDGGKTWKNISDDLNILLNEGEASFAASNTGLCMLKDKTWIISGGFKSRIFYSQHKGKNWESANLPIIQGKNTTGPFSVAFFDENKGAICGGDYALDTLSEKNFFLTADGGKTWTAPTKSPLGYRSCVCWITRDLLIATGTSGTDISRDGGKTWENYSKEGFNVVVPLKDGNAAILAGAKGKVAILSL